jgi:predicted enzyme related to lactoylglutathione lyase
MLPAMPPEKPVACVDYVELSAADGPAARAFYEAAFGWTFQEWGPEYLAFSDGRDSGGIRVEAERKAPLVILLTDDLDAVRARVARAGGKILGPDHVFPGGRRFHFLDPAGNEVAVWTKG